MEREVNLGRQEEQCMIVYVAECETCGDESDSTEDRNEAIMWEWQHIRKYTMGVEHRTKLHCYLVSTTVVDLTDIDD
jgi:hypothetical protein